MSTYPRDLDTLFTLTAGTYRRSGGIWSRAWYVVACPHPWRIILVETTDDRDELQRVLSGFFGIHTHTLISARDILLALTTDGIYIGSIDVVGMPYPTPHDLGIHTLALSRGDARRIEEVRDHLLDMGYEYRAHVSEEGSYRVDGDTLHVRPYGHTQSFRVGFFDTEIDEIAAVAPSGEMRAVESVTIVSRREDIRLSASQTHGGWYAYILRGQATVFFVGTDFTEEIDRIYSYFPESIRLVESVAEGSHDLGIDTPVVEDISALRELVAMPGVQCVWCTRRPETVEAWLSEHGLPRGIVMQTRAIGLESFALTRKKKQYVFLADDILSRIFVRQRIQRRSVSSDIDLLLQIRPGDYVVHRDHGVGRFEAVVTKDAGGVRREYLELHYREGDKLFVPMAEVARLTRYIGSESPTLTRLSTNEWKKTVASAEADVEKIAHELLETYAKRSIARGFSFLPFVKEETAFRKAFTYTYTADQDRSIEEVLADMESPEPMDRLLTGDVGFGKTEIAMNALYRAVLNRKQAAFVSPLVILAYEHHETLRQRFAHMGVRIDILTRLSTVREVQAVLERLWSGQTDIIVGTHRILGADVVFRDLGLLVIDEEHRFGVTDKEKINKIRHDIDILSLSATPIPRSLNMTLSGIRKLSIIATPPPRKKPIETVIAHTDDATVRWAILRELDRRGQVIFIHNRVQSLEKMHAYLKGLLATDRPDIRIGMVHGQMDGIQMEDRILDFKEGKYDILLSTTVIENGVNFLRANTILIDRSDMFGLAELHQLRGRVGRGDIQGYCYLLYDGTTPLPPDARRRLTAIVNNTHLGAGFEIAMQDLQIRGAGDILGVRQSGTTRETGMTLYFELLEEKINELRNVSAPRKIECRIDLSVSYHIDDRFFASEMDKIHFFREVERIDREDELNRVYGEFLRDCDDVVPDEFETLFLLLRVRIQLARYGIIAVRRIMGHYVLDFASDAPLDYVRAFLDRDRDSLCFLTTPRQVRFEASYFNTDLVFLKTLERRFG